MATLTVAGHALPPLHDSTPVAVDVPVLAFPFVVFRGLDSLVLSELATWYDRQYTDTRDPVYCKRARFCRALMGLVTKQYRQTDAEFRRSVELARRKVDRKVG